MADQVVINKLKDQASEMRKNLLKLCHKAGALHIGGDLSSADILTALYGHAMKFDPKNPQWEERDIFILSKGHTAGAVYIAQAMAGFYELDEVFEKYEQFESPFGQHPTAGVPGIEIATGSLGHGLSLCIGLALAARMDGKKHRMFTLMGDGEIQEGSVWEAAMAAGTYKLGNVVAIIDRNRISLDGDTEQLMKLEPLTDKWKSFGWNVMDIDGHDLEQIVKSFDELPAVDSDLPTVIIANTVKGKGVACMENDVNWHAGSIDYELLCSCIEEVETARNKERGE